MRPPLAPQPLEQPLESQDLARQIADFAAEVKAVDLVALDVRGKSSYTDFLVIASGTSDRHVQAICESVQKGMRQDGREALGVEGTRQGQWALLDYGDAVLHVFHQFTRDLYDLEELWNEAPRLSLTPEPATGTEDA